MSESVSVLGRCHVSKPSVFAMAHTAKRVLLQLVLQAYIDANTFGCFLLSEYFYTVLPLLLK